MAIGVIVLSLLFSHSRRELWLIYAVTFLYGLAGDLFTGSRSAFLRLMLEEELLVDANAAIQTAREGLRLVAPLAGAGLYAAFGGGVVAIVDAVTFGVSALTLARLRVDEHKPQAPRERFRVEFGAIAGGITAPLLLRRLGDAKLVGLGLIGFVAATRCSSSTASRSCSSDLRSRESESPGSSSPSAPHCSCARG